MAQVNGHIEKETTPALPGVEIPRKDLPVKVPRGWTLRGHTDCLFLCHGGAAMFVFSAAITARRLQKCIDVLTRLH